MLCRNTVEYDNKLAAVDGIFVAISQEARRLSVANIYQGLYPIDAIMMIVMSGEPRCLTSDVQHLEIQSVRPGYLFVRPLQPIKRDNIRVMGSVTSSMSMLRSD
jgi:hypothetical protein